jgi:hypothetical protein
MERRRSPRWAVNLAVDLRFDGLDCTGFTADVSPFGAYVRAGEDSDPLLGVVQVGDQLELRLGEPSGEPIEVRARVVRKHPAGLGLEFLTEEPRLHLSHLSAA